MTALSQELLDIIVDHVRDDPEILSARSIASGDFLPSCRGHRFKKVTLDSTALDSFVQITSASPDILPYIRELFIEPRPLLWNYGHDTEVPAMLNGCSNLQKLAIVTECHGNEPLQWTTLSPKLCDTPCQAWKLLTISHITLVGVHDIPLGALKYFGRGLKHLKFDNISFVDVVPTDNPGESMEGQRDKYQIDSFILGPKVSLKSHNLIDYLLSARSPFDFTHLVELRAIDVDGTSWKILQKCPRSLHHYSISWPNEISLENVSQQIRILREIRGLNSLNLLIAYNFLNPHKISSFSTTKRILNALGLAEVRAVTLILEPKIFDPDDQSSEDEDSWDALDSLLSKMATSSLQRVKVVHMESAEEMEVMESMEAGLEALMEYGGSHAKSMEQRNYRV